MKGQQGGHGVRGGMEDVPLVVAVTAHEMDSWEVEAALAGGALRDMEDLRLVGIRELLHLAQLRLGLHAVRHNELLVLQKKVSF